MDLIPTKAEIGQILRPQMWDATVTDMRLYPSVTIFCISAPAAPRQIMGGATVDAQSARSAFADTGGGSITGAISDSIALSGKLSVGAGPHTVKFRWRSSDGTLVMRAGKASMVTIRRYV